jgi:hypothetical protein
MDSIQFSRIKLTICFLLIMGTTVAAGAIRVSMLPDPDIRDQVIHDHGNLATTVDNFGYVGGYYWAGRPSGTWPTNSGRHYLAEMRFWIGGINSLGDTLLANTNDDFKPLMNWSLAESPTDIRLSTDTATYPYDPADTIGAGIGYPAYGWRVWDVATRDWIYNQVYHTLSSSYYPGGPLSVQESTCRYADDNSGSAVLGIEFTQTVRQWNYKQLRDIVFFTIEVTNVSAEDYTNIAFGLYCDFDVGGSDPVSGDNGRLGDLVDHDIDLDLAWTYDEDSYDPGWGPSVETGVMGTVLLATPGDVGMTSFNTGQWEFLPTTDVGRYELIDNTDFDMSLPPTDQYYVQGVRGIDFPAGTTIRIDFALLAAPNSDLLKTVAQEAANLYASNYIAARPPDLPLAKAAPGHKMTALRWDETAELSLDPSTGSADFRGYKVFRSTDAGETWGSLKINADYSVGPDYVPLKVFEFDDFGRIAHTYVDENLINGMEYWYAVVSYDSSSLEADYTSGTPETAENIVRVVPRSNPVGYISPQASLVHVYSGSWEAGNDSVNVFIVDQGEVTGDDYRLTFAEDCTDLTWNLTNTTIDEVVLADQDQFDGDASTFPVVDGLQIVIQNHRVPDTAYQSGFAMAEDITLETSLLEEFSPSVGCNSHFRNDIELRFTAGGSVAYDWFTHDPVSVPFEVWNITVDSQVGAWIADFGGDGEWTVTDEDYIMITNYDYDDGSYNPDVRSEYLTWIMSFDVGSNPGNGDVFTIKGPRLISPDDVFEFSSSKINATVARNDYDHIHVVPNPYLANASWENSEGVRKLQFVNLPEECTIRIYTLAGELIRTLSHTNGTGTEDWNMVSEAGRGIASGLYLYNVESQYGSYTGKFAVIK